MVSFGRLKPRFWDHLDVASGPGRENFGFRRKWLMIVCFTTVVTLTPLVVMTLMDYRLTRQAFESEASMGISRMVSNTWRSISFGLAQHRAALQFIARDNSPAALLQQLRLAAILDHLQQSTGGVVDLMAVDKSGRVLNYAGPYSPADTRVDAGSLIERTIADGFSVGDVTLDRKDRHHLVVAVRCDAATGDPFILGATLDATLMDATMAQLPLDAGDDAFVVNGDGILQTPARFLGRRYAKIPIDLPITRGGTRVVKTVDQVGHPILLGIAPIPQSPFRVVMTRQVSGIMDLWLIPRFRLIGFLVFSIALILVCILGGATYMVGRIHAADRRRVQALHQVEYANKLASIGRLASGVAHEINNPLAIINQKTGLIKDLFGLHPEWGGNPKLMGLVDDVLASVHRCGTITRRLLDFSRHMESSVETVDLEAVIRQVLALMEKEAQRRCIAVTVTTRGRVPAFQADHGNLQQIFLNLINNAFAAMADGGRLAVTIRPASDAHVQVTVSDTGHGIAEEDLKRIFEPFFSTRQGYGGTGLGLSVTYGMISEMGGSIAVDSQLNVGTRFTITLPLTPPAASPAGTQACPVLPPDPSAVDVPRAEEETT